MSSSKYFLTVLFSISFISLFQSQNLSAAELLDKAIAYHDPENHWERFSDTLRVTMTSPKNADRHSTIIINLPMEYFSVTATRDSITTTYTVDKNDCTFSLNGSDNVTKDQIEQYQLNCDRAELYKNYYTYLYGLPMKLKDPGTIIDRKVIEKEFKGKYYWVLRVRYEATVGSDIWNFYFDQETFAMEVYQFYKTDDKGSIISDSGEYILLNEISEISGIKMPKIREWYYNKNDGYLGTDTLTN